jgi:undecaprenyl-diphosphatase
VVRRLLELGDRIALRQFVRNLSPRLGSVIDRTGRLATGGGLWVGVAAALAMIGPRARRAARSGLVAYAASSAITNGPVKWANQRTRPRGVLLADLPRRGRRPRTSSLPSSHTASAAAFTVAAAIELPAAAPVLVTATSLVALQRMQAVRHYPTDVIAGLLTGAAIGAATTVALRRILDREAKRSALAPTGAQKAGEQDRTT